MIRLSKDGKISLSDQPLEPLSADFLTAQLSLQKKDVTASPFTYFKTSYRPHIEQKSYEQLFYNQAGQLLETSIGNLLSSWVRPLHTTSGCGDFTRTFRQELLATGQVQEKR